MKMNSNTEIIEQYMHESSVSPDKESRIINIGEITNIFSIGTEDALYLTKENETGEKSKFTRYKLMDHVTSFYAEKIDDVTIVISIVVDAQVYVVYTKAPETLKLEDFKRLDFSGVLGGIKLVPYRVLITSFGKGVSLFVEFCDPSGFTQQFMASLNQETAVHPVYYRLPSEFTKVVGNTAGKAARQFVDGVYTYGTFYADNDSPFADYVSDAPQLIYTPCRNPFGKTPPAPIRLKTETSLEAICTIKCTQANNQGTHLLAVGNGKLYFYPFNSQFDYLQEVGKGIPTIIAESNKLLNAKQIAAYILAERLYIFVRTAGGELNYTVSDYLDDKPGKFLEPVHFMSDVMGFDVHGGKMSIFTKDEFVECIQNPITGAFNMDTIAIETELDTYRNFSALSTRINVYRSNAEVKITSQNQKKIGFYANGYYYKTTEAVLESDSLGYVTIIQKADGISADCYSLTCGEETLDVNPAEHMHRTLLSMTEESDFKNAVITDPFGNTMPLVSSDKQSALAAAASGMATLHNTAIGILPGIDNPITKFTNGVIMTITDKVISILPRAITDNPFTQFIADVVSDITAAFKWIIDKVKELYDKTLGKVINFVIQKTEKVWKFVAEIGGKVISVVVDCMEKVTETIQKVLEIIGIPVGKIIDFFKKAFGFDRADRINAAIKNVAFLSIDLLVKKAADMKETSVVFLTEAIHKMEQWAGIDKESFADQIAFNPFSSDHASKLTDMGITLDSHNMYAMDLIKRAITPNIMLPDILPSNHLSSAMQVLLYDINTIGESIGKIPEHLSYIANEMKDLIKDFNVEHFVLIMKKILGIVSVDFLSISCVIIKTIFDIVIEGIKVIWEAISTPIHIPFLSDVLKIFGIHEFSLIDIITYPTAFLASAVSGVTRLVSGQELFDLTYMDELAKLNSLEDLKKMGGGIYAG